jgi:hypothetical protein
MFFILTKIHKLKIPSIKALGCVALWEVIKSWACPNKWGYGLSKSSLKKLAYSFSLEKPTPTCLAS